MMMTTMTMMKTTREARVGKPTSAMRATSGPASEIPTETQVNSNQSQLEQKELNQRAALKKSSSLA